MLSLTLESPSGGLPQQQPLMLEHLARPHHVLLAEGVAVLQLGGAAVLHAAAHLLQPLVPLVLADAQVHSSDHLPHLAQRLGEVRALLGALCRDGKEALDKRSASATMAFSQQGAAEDQPSVCCRILSSNTGYLVILWVTSKMHSGISRRFTKELLPCCFEKRCENFKDVHPWHTGNKGTFLCLSTLMKF